MHACRSTLEDPTGQSSYHAAAQAQGFRLDNPEHRLSADFTREAVRVRAGTGTWTFSLRSYGYGDEPRAAAQVAPRAEANRVEYRRGHLTEWYVNGPLGLEQGFTLAEAPGNRTGAPLTLALSVSGNLVATVDGIGRNAILGRPGEPASLRYRGLTANDATGRELRAWLDVDDGQLLLRVDDADARYPLVVDPFIEQATLTASVGSAGDLFGVVGADGDTIVVGARLGDVGPNIDQGSAYVFVKPAGGWSGPLTESARLIASDGAANDSFGSVAVSGDTIVVGANGCPDANVCNTRPVAAHGSAYVFVKPAEGWSGTLTEQAKLIASDGASNDLFGTTVDIEGDTIVVGSEWDDSFRGSVYVFVKPSAGWTGTRTQDAKLIASDRAATGAGIGQALGRAQMSGDTIVAGALGADVLDASGLTLVDAGAAYVFVRPAEGWSGTLTQRAKLIASDRAAGDRFGSAAAVDGDTVAVGAANDDTGVMTDHGSAYVFVKPVSGWSGTQTQQAKLVASDKGASDRLNNLRIEGDTIVAGAPLGDAGLAADAGAVYLFSKPSGGWSGTVAAPLAEAEKLTASDGAMGDSFGGSLALSGDLLVVGATANDIGASANQGSAYVFVIDRALANAGVDQTVQEGEVVRLDASASGGQSLSFDWQQIAGPTAALDDPTSSTPSFTAPLLSGGFGSQVLTFQLTVTGSSGSSSDTIDVTVVNVNSSPVAEAGADQTVNEGSPVMLDGSASFDPDGDTITHRWAQIGGTPVELADDDTPAPSFAAPFLAGGLGGIDTLVFELTVSDGALPGSDTVRVVVEQVNHPPTADAGPDQTVSEGASVTLDGRGSGDPDGDTITSYRWSQVAGAPVALSDASSPTPSFTAPAIGPGGATLVFELVVSDGLLASEPALAEPNERVTIHVVDANDPPFCGAARPTAALLWPPNYKMVQVGITGVADPNDEQLEIEIMAVTQDEPPMGSGDGDTSPDAVIQGDAVLLRAERNANGNGRIYRIHFIATDTTGGSCTASVDVAVPHSRNGASAADDGQIYTSP